MNDFPIRLKAEDQPSPPDAHTIAVEHLDALRQMVDESRDLQRLLTRWDANPLDVFRRAQARAVELAEAAGRALDSGELLVQASRRESLFSFDYSDEVRHGR